MEKNMKNNLYLYIYICLYYLCCTPEANTTLYINYTSIFLNGESGQFYYVCLKQVFKTHFVSR